MLPMIYKLNENMNSSNLRFSCSYNSKSDFVFSSHIKSKFLFYIHFGDSGLLDYINYNLSVSGLDSDIEMYFSMILHYIFSQQRFYEPTIVNIMYDNVNYSINVLVGRPK